MGANNSTAESTHAQLSSLYLLVPSLYPRRHSRGIMYQALPPAFLHEFKGHAIIARARGGSLGTRLASNHSDYTSITFKDNYAEHTGGAILVAVRNTLGVTKCFLKGCVLHLFFLNNTARLGGNDIYGGQFDQTPVCDRPKSCKNIEDVFCHGIGSHSCISVIDTISQFSDARFSSIASDPSRVCLCNESGLPDCLNVLTGGFVVYPGQTFTLSAVAVGQHFGTTFGTVCAQLLSLNEKIAINLQ